MEEATNIATKTSKFISMGIPFQQTKWVMVDWREFEWTDWNHWANEIGNIEN